MTRQSDDGSTEPELLVTREDFVLVMTLNRPDVRNAVNQALSRQLADALDELDADNSLRVGVITGAGGTFCAGLDLKAYLAGEPGGYAGRGFAGLTEAPPAKPLIAAVEGAAVAGGCEIVLSCDLVVAARDAGLGLPEVRRGLIAGSGGLLRLPGRIPLGMAMQYALTGDLMRSEEACRLGLVNVLTEPGDALAGALELAQRIAANAPLAVALTKRMINGSRFWAEAEALDRQREMLATVFSSEDAQEGSAAFLEKRAPRWRGR